MKKFVTSPILILAIGLVIGSAGTWFILKRAQRNNPYTPHTVILSQAINCTEFTSLRADYHNNAPLEISNSSGEVNNLEGFTFEAKQIDSLINRNPYAINGRKVDKVALYLGSYGRSFESRNLPGVSLCNTTIIAVALGDDNSILGSTNARSLIPTMIYDHADPCPPCILPEPSCDRN